MNSKNETGQSQIINVPLDDAYDVAGRVIESQGATITKLDKTNRLIVGEYGVSPFGAGVSYGAILGIYFDSAGVDRTAVKVVQKNRCKMCPIEKDYIDPFLISLGQQSLSQSRGAKTNAPVIINN